MSDTKILIVTLRTLHTVRTRKYNFDREIDFPFYLNQSIHRQPESKQLKTEQYLAKREQVQSGIDYYK